METRWNGTHTEGGERPHAALFLQTHKSSGHCSQTLWKILLTRVLQEVKERRLLRVEQFGLRPRHSTTLQQAYLVVKVNRNFDERRVTGTVFPDVAKAFDTVLVWGLLYKLTVLNFPPYLVKTVSSYLDCRTFQTSFQSAMSTCDVMRAGEAQGGHVSPVLFSLYVNEGVKLVKRVCKLQWPNFVGRVSEGAGLVASGSVCVCARGGGGGFEPVITSSPARFRACGSPSSWGAASVVTSWKSEGNMDALIKCFLRLH
jgi:hypothetical protein